MKVFVVLLAICIVQVVSQLSPQCEQKAKDIVTLINGWSGNLDGLKTAIKAKFEEGKAEKKNISPDEINKFFDEICKQFKSGLWTCDEFKKWAMEEWSKA